MLTSLPGASNDALGLWTNMDSWNLVIQLLVELQTVCSLTLDFQFSSVGIINHLPMSRMDGTCMAKVSQHVSTINQSMASQRSRVKNGQSQAANHWGHWVNVSHICTAPAWMRIPCISGWDHHGCHNHRRDIQLGFSPTPTPFQKKMCWKHLKNQKHKKTAP